MYIRSWSFCRALKVKGKINEDGGYLIGMHVIFVAGLDNSLRSRFMQHKESWSWTRRTFMKSSVAGALLFAGKLLIPAVRSEVISNCEAVSERESHQKARRSRHVCLGKRRASRGDRDLGANYVPAAYRPMLEALLTGSLVSNTLFSRESPIAALRVWLRPDDRGGRSLHCRC